MIGMATAVKRLMANTVCINSARGSIFTVTTAMMETKNPSEVNVSATAVLWYIPSEIATGIDPLPDKLLSLHRYR